MVHGTAIAIDGQGVLLIGPSATGKSDLALRLIDRGALLVSDDAVMLAIHDSRPHLQAAPNINELLEVRGVGICRMPTVASAPMRLLVQLDRIVERLPTDNQMTELQGFDVPTRDIAAFEASAPIKVELALRSVIDAGLWPVAVSRCDPSESASI